jgi:hypothetical protein
MLIAAKDLMSATIFALGCVIFIFVATTVGWSLPAPWYCTSSKPVILMLTLIRIFNMLVLLWNSVLFAVMIQLMQENPQVVEV